MKPSDLVKIGSESLTMSLREYLLISGRKEYATREDIRAGKIPHVLCGRRGIIRILRVPALAQLGLDVTE
jgi:hypothetical protein